LYIVIAGAGLVGQGLGRRLGRAKNDVVLIELDARTAELVYTRHGIVTVVGSATDIDVLEDAGIKKADVAVALMRNDADNLAFALLANSFGVPRIIVRMRDPKYSQAYHSAGVSNTISTIDLFLDELMLEIEQPAVRRAATLGGGKAVVAVITLPETCVAAGKTVAWLTSQEGFPRDCVIAGIYKPATDEFVVPRGTEGFSASDQVFLAATAEDIKLAAKFLGVS